MVVLTEKEIELFRGSAAVRKHIAALEETARAYQKQLHTLIGKRVTNARGTYQITYVGGYQGKITGRGRKVLKNGKLGSKTWDLHSITEHSFTVTE